MTRIESPTFVGRAAELAALDGALEVAAQGHTTTVLIGGDAGVGKTRLLARWNERARGLGARLATGACLDLGETGPAYAALVEALRELLGGLDATEEDALVGPDRTVLARVIPELAFGGDQAILDGQLPRFAQIRVFDRLTEVLHRSAAQVPIVLELEDIHWADPSTRAFLPYLAEVSRDSRLLLIATYRPDEAAMMPAFRTMLEQLLRRPRVTALLVRPFDADELRAQLSGILGVAPSSALLSAIQARSEGNALFAEELVAARDPLAELPKSVAAMTATKLSALSTIARSVLRVASVIGRTTSYDVLRAVTSLNDSELADALREAVGARLLVPGHVGESYQFRHALLQEAVYDETLPGERRRLHEAVGFALWADPDRPPHDADLAPRLAHHWYEARAYDRAFRASIAAADAAAEQAAYAEALRHYDRVVELWDQAVIALRDERLASVHERAARVAFLAGDLEASARHGRLGLGALVDAPDDGLRLRILDQLAATLQALGDDPSEVFTPVAEMELAGRTKAEQAVILFHRSLVLREAGEHAAALELARPLPALARSLEDLVLEARTTMIVADLVYMHAPDESLAGFRTALDLAARSGDTVLETDVQGTLCELLLYAGRNDDLLAETTSALAFAQRAGLSRLARPRLLYHRAWALLQLGRLAECVDTIRLALADEPSGRVVLLLHLVAAQALIAMGELDEAAAHVLDARKPGATEEDELGRGYLATVRAQLAIAQGRLEDALQVVAVTAPRVAAAKTFTEMSETMWWLAEVGLGAAAGLAEVGRAAGNTGAIAEMHDVAETLVVQLDRVRQQREDSGMPDIGTLHGHEALIAGHLARIEGRDEPALWEAVAADFPPRSIGALTARYRQAEAMLGAGVSRDQVRAIMSDAHITAVEIGARPLARQFESLARRARIDVRSAPVAVRSEEVERAPEAGPPPGTAALRKRGLSEREIEVLTLVAAGFSNHEIGTRLFISDKTASVHVSHILTKLVAASRTEAATIGVRLGLPEVERDDEPPR